jgi:hypothetical protein
MEAAGSFETSGNPIRQHGFTSQKVEVLVLYISVSVYVRVFVNYGPRQCSDAIMNCSPILMTSDHPSIGLSLAERTF